MRFIVCGGNPIIFDYPQRFTVAFENVGQALYSVGWEGKYIGFSLLNIDDITAYKPDIFYILIPLAHRDMLEKLKQISTYCFIFGETDGEDLLIENIDLETRILFIETLQYIDVLVANNNAIKRKLVAYTDKPVVCGGCPIDIEYTEGFIDHSADKTFVYHGQYIDRRLRDLTTSIAIAEKLGLLSLVLLPVDGMYSDIDHMRDYFTRMGFSRLTYKPIESQDRFLYNWFSKCQMNFLLSTSVTMGRLCAEASVLKIPSIGTRSRYQEELFPETTIDFVDFYKVKELVERLRDDKAFHKEVVETARMRAEMFNLQNQGRYLVELYETFKGGRGV